MQQVRTETSRQPSILPTLEETRLSPVVHLLTGDVVNLVAETCRSFEDRASFGGNGLFINRISPALWMAHQIEAVAELVNEPRFANARPIIIEAPITALMHPDTPMACEAAAARSRLCPQEICVEVEDATLSQSKSDIVRSIEALRRRGFRVGVNATPACACCWTACASMPRNSGPKRTCLIGSRPHVPAAWPSLRRMRATAMARNWRT